MSALCCVLSKTNSKGNTDSLKSLLKNKNYSSCSWLAREAAKADRFVSSQKLCLFSKDALIRVAELVLCPLLRPGRGAVPAFWCRAPLLLEAVQFLKSDLSSYKWGYNRVVVECYALWFVLISWKVRVTQSSRHPQPYLHFSRLEFVREHVVINVLDITNLNSKNSFKISMLVYSQFVIFTLESRWHTTPVFAWSCRVQSCFPIPL